MSTLSPRQPRADWGAARAFYVCLGPEQRSCRRVAAEFTVSETTVKKWAKRQDWPGVAAKADDEVSRRAMTQVIHTRSERVAAVLRFVDDYVEEVGAKLRSGKLDVKASDVSALVRTAELLVGEPTDSVQISQLRRLLDAYDAALDDSATLPQTRTGPTRSSITWTTTCLDSPLTHVGGSRELRKVRRRRSLEP